MNGFQHVHLSFRSLSESHMCSRLVPKRVRSFRHTGCVRSETAQASASRVSSVTNDWISSSMRQGESMSGPAPATSGTADSVFCGNGEPTMECQSHKGDRDASALARDREVKRFARRLSKVFAKEISSDPRTFKKGVIETLRRHLPPFAGRPTEEAITTAAALRAERREWPEIYRLVIPGHCELDSATRRQMESNLRSAIRSRRNARKRRKARQKLIAETSQEHNVPL